MANTTNKEKTLKIINQSRSVIILQLPLSFEDENKEIEKASKENRSALLDLGKKECKQIILNPVDDYVVVPVTYLQNDFVRNLFAVGDLEIYDPKKSDKKIPKHIKNLPEELEK